MTSQRNRGSIELSIISPARNEAENLNGFLEQVAEGLCSSGIRFELLIVDDGSTDLTSDLGLQAMPSRPWLRILKIHRDPGDLGCGKSAALLCGIQAACGDCIAFIDADGQNEVRDLIGMLQLLRQSRCDMVHGDRSGHRCDNWRRRLSSIAASRLRQLLLHDGIRDSACGLLLMTREMAEALPLQFAGIHRFLPCYAKIAGYTVLQVPVAHRPRIAGKSKYGFGNRFLRSLIDMLVLRWMRSRFKEERSEELQPAKRGVASEDTAVPAPAACAREVESRL